MSVNPFQGAISEEMIKAGEDALSASAFLSECLTNSEADPVEKRKAVIDMFTAMEAAKAMR